MKKYMVIGLLLLLLTGCFEYVDVETTAKVNQTKDCEAYCKGYLKEKMCRDEHWISIAGGINGQMNPADCHCKGSDCLNP